MIKNMQPSGRLWNRTTGLQILYIEALIRILKVKVGIDVGVLKAGDHSGEIENQELSFTIF
jgi:hypothetical protein